MKSVSQKKKKKRQIVLAWMQAREANCFSSRCVWLCVCVCLYIYMYVLGRRISLYSVLWWYLYDFFHMMHIDRRSPPPSQGVSFWWMWSSNREICSSCKSTATMSTDQRSNSWYQIAAGVYISFSFPDSSSTSTKKKRPSFLWSIVGCYPL